MIFDILFLVLAFMVGFFVAIGIVRSQDSMFRKQRDIYKALNDEMQEELIAIKESLIGDEDEDDEEKSFESC